MPFYHAADCRRRQENTFLSARGLVEAGHECVMLTGPSEGREGQLLQKMKIRGLK